MTLLVPNNGEGRILNNMVNKVAPQDLRLKLYQNNITPAETDTAATYTVASWAGYANFDFVAANWTITEGAPSDASYAEQIFTSSANQSSQSNYGYYIIQVTSGILMWVERFSDGPYNIVNLNDAIKITPKITLD